MTLTVVDMLQRPIPDQGAALERKSEYRKYPLDLNDPRNSEPLVDIAAYNLAGQSYYSRPNAATGIAIPQVDPVVRVRRGIAEKLTMINEALRASKDIRQLFGADIELYVEEGVRSSYTQRMLYDVVFPRLIRAQFPAISEDELLARRANMIARPSGTKTSPSPHSTGAAIDISLRYAQATRAYVPNCEVFMGNEDADMDDIVRPDFFEQTNELDDKYQLAQRNRRLFYWIMKGKLCAEDSGLCVNPTEWWHWSYGDQMWATITAAPFAFYGSAE